MAIGIDDSNRKPRRVKGTPSQIIRNRFGYAIIGFGALLGLGFHFSSVTKNLRDICEEYLLYEPEGELERKQLIAANLAQKSADLIRRQREREMSPALPYK